MKYLPKDLFDKLKNQHPEVIEALTSLNLAAQYMTKSLDSINLSSHEVSALWRQLNEATEASTSWATELNRAYQSYAELNNLCQQLNRVVAVEGPDGDTGEFQLKPEMLHFIKIDVTAESDYNDEGGHSTYYSCSGVSISLDQDVAMAMNPAFFAAEGIGDPDAEPEEYAEALKDFFEELEFNIEEILQDELYLEWACYDGVPEITQEKLSMAGQAGPIGKLPLLYIPD